MIVDFVDDGDARKFVKALRKLLRENTYARGDALAALEVAALQSGHVELPDSFDHIKGWDWNQGVYAHSCAVKFQQDTGLQREEHDEEYIEWLLDVFKHDLLDPESYQKNGDDLEVLWHVAAYVYASQHVRHVADTVERRGRHSSPDGQRSMFEREVRKVLTRAEWAEVPKTDIVRRAYQGKCPAI